MSDLLAAVAIAMILEGIMPFVSPKGWKAMVSKIAQFPEQQLRTFGFLLMLSGVAFLYMVR